jgi:hypothetical protein
MLIGCDFSSSPSKRKPIVLAVGQALDRQVRLLRLESFETLNDFAHWLAQTTDWVGGFDLPFGLPRELVETLGWPQEWLQCIHHYANLSREQIRGEFSAFCNARPVGAKFAHRQTDGPAGSSPSMKWVNPPVAFMLHAGVPLLIQAGVSLPGLHAADPRRVALEAYPGLLAREILGRRSYKSDDKAKQNTDRLLARKDILSALERGQTRLQLRLKLSTILSEKLVHDPTGDALDAALCLMQAAWAVQPEQRHTTASGFGLPDFDPLEGWILSA